MARRDPESHRRKRAEEDLEKALRRGDLDLALAALETLRGGFPAGALEKISRSFRAAVSEAHRMAQWARLHSLAVRAESISALLEPGAPPGEPDPRWALLWGCARSRDFARARTLAQALAPRLGDRPALVRAMTEILEREGAVSDDLFAALPESLRRGSDDRLGHEPPPVRTEAPRAPTNPQDAREAVLLLAHRVPLVEAAGILQRWIDQAPPAVSTAIRATAVPVARMEILRRFRDRSALGPAVRVLLVALPSTGRTREEVDILLEAMRLLASSSDGAPLDLDRDQDGFAFLARALLQEPAFGPSGARWLVSVTGSVLVGPGRDRLLEKLLAAHPSDFVLWSLVCARMVDAEEATEPPSWLWQCLDRTCADSGALARSWAAIPADDVGPLIERLTTCVPLALGLRLVEQSWPGASPELRHHLCHMVDELSDEGFSRPDPDELDALDLDTSMRKLAERMLTRTLAGPTRGLWIRLGRELLAVAPHLLPYAIQAAGPSLADRKRYLNAWLDDRAIVDEWLAALTDVARVPLHDQELCASVFDHLLQRFTGDAEPLARALLRLEDHAPVPALLRIAHALLDATPRRAQERSLEVREALALARRVARGRPVARRKGKKAKPQAGARPEAREPRRRRRRSAEQLELGLDAETTSADRLP